MDTKMRLAGSLIGATLALTGAVGASTAQAASGDYGLVLANTNVRTSPYISPYNVAFVTKVNARLPFQCWRDTQSTPDNGAWRRWFKISYQERWVAADRVVNQPSLPRC